MEQMQTIKEQIIENALDNYEDMSPSELMQYIKLQLESYNLVMNVEEEKNVIYEIKIRVEDEARAFPSRERNELE